MIKRLVLCLIALFLCSAASTAYALTARETAEREAQKILSMLNDPAFKNEATRPAMKQKIEKEVIALFDFEEFSTRTVGQHWKKFTPQQKEEFKTAFTDLIRNSYIDTLDEYNGQQVQFTGELSSGNGTRVEVQMNFVAGQQTYPVAFRMLQKNDAWVVYDVIIEGISMIKNYRDQFRDILVKSSPDELIKRVREKAAEQKNKKSGKK